MEGRPGISGRALRAIAIVVLLMVAGCSSAAPVIVPSTTTAPASSPAPTPGTLAQIPLPVNGRPALDGLVKVAGHNLAVYCAGSGSPTVVVLHGWIDEPGVPSYGFYGALREVLTPDFRVCSYDRANVGFSESVAGTQTPEMVVGDLDGLMEAIGDRGPYLLIGQSAGGMVASAYAVAHPDKVAGLVMVDSSFDDEITLEDVGMVPSGAGPCDPSNRKADGYESLQKIDNCTIYKWSYSRRELRPKVPLVYLAAKWAPWSDQTDLGPKYQKAIIPLQKAYAASWSPGKFEWVDSGHEIHIERPEVVAAAVKWVLKNRHGK